jgi:hypothetical protein
MKPTLKRIGNFRQNAYAILPAYLNEGMNHLAGGRWKQAKEHFQKLPSSSGIYLHLYPVEVKTTPKTIQEAQQYMLNAAEEQVPRRGPWGGPRNEFGIINGDLHLTTYRLPDDTPKQVSRYADYSQAISGAEETIHALQGQYGQWVSPEVRGTKPFKFNPNELTTKENWAELDVAQHFADRGIPVPQGFMEKYASRGQVTRIPRILSHYPVIS